MIMPAIGGGRKRRQRSPALQPRPRQVLVRDDRQCTSPPGYATRRPCPSLCKRPIDPNALAHSILQDVIAVTAQPAKDPATVALGRKGGEIAGAVRASRMTPEQRSEAARSLPEPACRNRFR